MKRILALICGVVLATLLSACSSPPELTQPKGNWIDANPAVTNTSQTGENHAASKK